MPCVVTASGRWETAGPAPWRLNPKAAQPGLALPEPTMTDRSRRHLVPIRQSGRRRRLQRGLVNPRGPYYRM